MGLLHARFGRRRRAATLTVTARSLIIESITRQISSNKATAAVVDCTFFPEWSQSVPCENAANVPLKMSVIAHCEICENTKYDNMDEAQPS